MIFRSVPWWLSRLLRTIKIGALAAALALVIAGGILGWHRQIRALDDLRVQALLTLIGLGVGAWLTNLQLKALATLPRLTLAGLAAIAISQAGFYLLVWTDWKASTPLWRVWWIAMIGSVATTHMIVLFSWVGERGARTARATAACVLIACLLLMALGLRPDLLATPSALELWVWLVPAAGAVLGSMILWYRTRSQPAEPRPRSRWRRLAWISACFLLTFLAGFYAGRVTTPPPSPVDLLPTNLAELAPDKLDQQVRGDLVRLKAVAVGVDDLVRKNTTLRASLQARLSAEQRKHFLPEEENELKAGFMSYLACRAALLRLVATYGGFAAVNDRQARDRCFLVGFGAGTALLHASRALVSDFRDDPPARAKLNEADLNWGIPAGMFERIYENAQNERNSEICEEMAAYYQERRTRWRGAGLFADEDFDWLDGRIDSALAGLRQHAVAWPQARLDRLVRRVKEDAYAPVYATQSLVSIWIGDTRLLERPPFIRHEQIEELRTKLQPGDILLERRNWFLSNAFLPGFWPHAALYVGGIEDLQRLGIVRRHQGGWTSEHAVVRERLPAYLEKTEDGHAHTVIESVSEGVIFNSLSHSMHADYVAVLRPRLTEADKARAIVRAFSHQGKPYDFEFDFATADKLVCTELVYRSYEGMLKFELVRIMGRDTLPAVEIGRTFARGQGTSNPQLDFVLFLDAVPAENRCRFAAAEGFCESCARPRGFNE
jgi:hypothetical protein